MAGVLCQCWSNNAKLPLHAKISLIKRATLPHLDSHAARWPFTRERARWLDQLQRRMIGSCIVTASEPEDTAELFVRRRNSDIAGIQRRMGRWSNKWAKLQVSWHDHLLRERNSWAWGAQLLAIRTPQELEGHRLVFGRVHTHAVSGWCASRWCETVEIAKVHV